MLLPRRHSARLLIGVAALAFCASSGFAQDVSVDVSQGVVVARFSDATRLRADHETLFVVDRGGQKVAKVEMASHRVGFFGGSSPDAGRLDQPTDVDPTNGLSVLVADAFGRVQRFDRNSVLLETLRLGDGTPEWMGPFAIASVDERTLFIVDEGSAQLFRWTRDRGLTAVRSNPLKRGSKPEFADLAATPNNVFVADGTSGCVLLFDSFGTYDRFVACLVGATIRGLVEHKDQLWVTRQSKDGVVVDAYDLAGKLAVRYALRNVDGIVGAFGDDLTLWVLTPNSLLAVPLTQD